MDKLAKMSLPSSSASSGSSNSGSRRVTLEDFDVIKLLGKGAYGEVVLCENRFNQKLCALKSQKKKLIVEENRLPRVSTENRVLKLAEHPFLTKLLCSFQTGDSICFVMEYVSGGDLITQLQDGTPFSEYTSQFYGAELILAVSYLHSRGIIHRDIKCENILLTSDGHIKLTDFGLSICESELVNGKTNDGCGTREYMAPEVLCKQDYGMEVDWWSFGIVMYAMLHANLPFSSGNPEELKKKILFEKPKLSPRISTQSINLLERLLAKSLERRLGVKGGSEEIKQHPFFESVDWWNMYLKKIPTPFVPSLESEVEAGRCSANYGDDSQIEADECLFDISFKDLSLSHDTEFEDSE